ncbi:hypothetical protein ACWGNF_12890 [Streptomyces sp. NPDC055808]|uniref:hypothetical protein n=1 Tax=Streptomyces sp. NPDC001828 TaxID=3364615 RepID=UPI0036B508BC
MDALVSAAERPGPAPHRPAPQWLTLVQRAAAQGAGRAPVNLARVMAAYGNPTVPAASAFQSAL